MRPSRTRLLDPRVQPNSTHPIEMPTTFRKTGPNEKMLINRILRKIFVDDWIMKLVALLITLTLWMGVTGLRTPTTARLKSVALNLKVQNDVEVMSAPVAEVDLVVTGDKRKVDLLNPRDLVASLDLTSVEPGERTVQVTADNIRVELPTGVRLESVEPGIIPVTLERVLEKYVPVKVEVSGALPVGLEVYSATANPSAIRVRGPESVVRTVDSVTTEKVALKGRMDDFSVSEVALQAVNPKARLEDTVVGVQVKIGEKRVERQVSVPVSFDGKRRTAVITLYGPAAAFETLRPEDLGVEPSRDSNGDLSVTVMIPSSLKGTVEVRKRQIK